MKKIGAIRHKLKQVRHRLLQKSVRNELSKKPCNCKHSGLVRGNSSEPLFYVCLLDSENPREWEGTICDPSVPNTCPFFKTHHTKEEVEERFNREFDSLLEESDMGKIASKYPDVAALLWVIAGNEDEGQEDDEPSSRSSEDEG